MGDLFKREELATKYCEQYGVEVGSDLHSHVFNAFCVGYTMPQEDVKTLQARVAELESQLSEATRRDRP